MAISQDVWARLSGEPTDETLLRARIALPDITDRLVAAQDADNRRHLLIRLHENEYEIQDTQSRGLSVTTRALTVPGNSEGQYLDIVCQDSAGHDAFDIIGEDIAVRLATGTELAPEIVSRVLASWRRFWGELPTQMLSREETLGLFGELWFLAVWLAPQAGIAEAVRRWRGPARSRHDFEWPQASVEIKATTSTRGKIHRIHGLDQLSPPEAGQLMLFSLQLREERGATNSLPSIIATCRSEIGSDANSMMLFDGLLIQSGYLQAHEQEYSRTHFRIVSEGLFRVDGDFPRLTPASFPAGVPVGVDYIEYELNLAACAEYLVATHPNELPVL